MLRIDDLGPAPLTLNDDEISSDSVQLMPTKKFNDMSFFALMLRGMSCNKTILSLPDDPMEGWNAKLQVVRDFAENVTEQYIDSKPDSPPLQRFAARAATGLISAMQLIIRRPPYRQYSASVLASDDFDVLDCATKILQHELEIKSPEFAIWAWKSWVQWYSLAIVLAELCNQPPGERFDTSFAAAARIFEEYKKVVADDVTGGLWKPIAKLMRRVQQQRLNRLEATDMSPNDGGKLLEQDLLSAMFIDHDAPALDASVPWAADLGVLLYPQGNTPGNIPRKAFLHSGQPGAGNEMPFDWSMFMDEVDMQLASGTTFNFGDMTLQQGQGFYM